MKDQPESPEVVLARAWAQIRESMRPRVPTLGISIDYVPGKYLFTHPAPSNVVFWWQEIIDFAQTIDLSILSAIAANTFLGQASLAKVTDDVLKRAMLERDYHAESAIANLYAMREKIGWLVFELIHHLVPSPPGQRQLSYTRVLRVLDESLSRGAFSTHYLGEEAILRVTKLYRELDAPDIRRLFKFRHSLTHHNRPRVQPRFDQPVIGRSLDGDWDIHELGSYRFVFIEHLSLAAWFKYVEVLRGMALGAEWKTLGLKLNLTEGSPSLNPEQLVHSGRLALDLGYGIASVRCMKQCRGYDVSIDFKEPIRDNRARSRVLSDVTKAFGPLLGYEHGPRVVVGGQEKGDDRRMRILLLIPRSDRVNSLSDHESECVAEAADATERGRVTREEVLLSLARIGLGHKMLRTLERWLNGETTAAILSEMQGNGRTADYCLLLRRGGSSSPGEQKLHLLLYQKQCDG